MKKQEALRNELKEEIELAREEAKLVKEEVRLEVNEEVNVIKASSFKDNLQRIFSLTDDVASHEEIRERLLDGGKFTGTNMSVLILAILIASVGLNTGSTAVIIGAMLISPLMGSILAMAYGTASADSKTLLAHFIGYLSKVGISVVASCIYFVLSPVKDVTAELLARTQPRFFDVIIAICGGLAGIIGQTRKDKANNIIPGVAIATALMPPLCTCGYAIANGKWQMLFGAMYLFLVNSYFIFMSSTLILSLLSVPKVKELTLKQWKGLKIRMIRNAIIISIPSIVIGILMSVD